MTLEDRLMQFVSPEPTSGCWLWTGCVTPKGYGQFWLGAKAWAHRVAFELFRGPIPQGMQIDHKCRVRCCVNPEHLEPVTLQENVSRGNVGWRASEEVCGNGHIYGAAPLRAKDGSRMCRECRAVYNSTQRQKKRGQRLCAQPTPA